MSFGSLCLGVLSDKMRVGLRFVGAEKYTIYKMWQKLKHLVVLQFSGYYYLKYCKKIKKKKTQN